MYAETTATKKVIALTKRIRAIQGGTSASKTISILLYLIARAQSDKTATLTSVVSESFPHLKRGAIRDFLSIMQTHHYFKDERWNKTDSIYTFETGSKLEFFSADQPDKVRGPRRDRLFINEANNVAYEAFDQLEVRTREVIFLDWNPANEFWFYTDVLPTRSDVEHLVLTYRDNEALDPAIVASIEQRKKNLNWWRVYGEGLLGVTEAQIYKDWRLIDAIPFEARLLGYGLDFGYSNDPTAIVAVYKHNDGVIADEVCYQKGLSNRHIADILTNLERAPIIADRSEPKSIDELRAFGLTVLASKKGPGSVSQGIQYVQNQKISVTKSSVNLIKEYRNYLWETDKNGKILNTPEQGLDHALDALRYRLERANQRQAARQAMPTNTQAYRRRSPHVSSLIS